jgi:hypothetical protein
VYRESARRPKDPIRKSRPPPSRIAKWRNIFLVRVLPLLAGVSDICHPRHLCIWRGERGASASSIVRRLEMCSMWAGGRSHFWTLASRRLFLGSIRRWFAGADCRYRGRGNTGGYCNAGIMQKGWESFVSDCQQHHSDAAGTYWYCTDEMIDGVLANGFICQCCGDVERTGSSAASLRHKVYMEMGAMSGGR